MIAIESTEVSNWKIDDTMSPLKGRQILLYGWSSTARVSLLLLILKNPCIFENRKSDFPDLQKPL